jgi:hypothetical protein
MEREKVTKALVPDLVQFPLHDPGADGLGPGGGEVLQPLLEGEHRVQLAEPSFLAGAQHVHVFLPVRLQHWLEANLEQGGRVCARARATFLQEPPGRRARRIGTHRPDLDHRLDTGGIPLPQVPSIEPRPTAAP